MMPLGGEFIFLLSFNSIDYDQIFHKFNYICVSMKLESNKKLPKI